MATGAKKPSERLTQCSMTRSCPAAFSAEGLRVMKRVIYSALVLVFLNQFSLVCGQQQSHQASQVTQEPSIYPGLAVHAKEYCDSYLLKNNVRLIELTYPKVIERRGRANLLTDIAGGQEQLHALGIQTLSWTPMEATKLVSHSGSIYAVIPTTIENKRQESTWKWDLWLIAASKDQGYSWTFVSSNCVDVCEMFPQIAGEIAPFLRKVPTEKNRT